jgi:hypothetical protein
MNNTRFSSVPHQKTGCYSFMASISVFGGITSSLVTYDSFNLYPILLILIIKADKIFK